ncbi:MAG: flagellin B [Sulfurimonas sp.]|nr:flagellin B [Sulfurimonas sp.]
MGFRINTNIAAMNSHRNAVNTNLGLDKSLNSLSSGLRINKAADDASGMTIADSLRSQAQGLGQAINNANDGVAVIQTADGALDEYINIINTVRTKAIQAASDGQNADSRKAIQADIDRLLEAANGIATTTQFNGQQLLDGTYTNKAFHIGAYANETLNLSVANTQVDAVGAVNKATDNGTFQNSILAAATASQVSDTGAHQLTSLLTINGSDVTATLNSTYANKLLDASSVAAAISDATNVHAIATNTMVGSGAMSAGTISGGATDFLKINGVNLGAVTLTALDSTKSLKTAINSISDLTGVSADVDKTGVLTLTSKDGSNISIDAGGLGATLTGLADNQTQVTAAANTALSATSVTSVTLTAGELVINGIDMAGTYGSGGAGSAADELKVAIRKIDGLETSTVSGGQVVLNENTGIDINVAGSSTAANGDNVQFVAAQQGIFNSSDKGEIILYSNDTISIVTTDKNDNKMDNVIGFKEEALRVAAGADRLSTIDVTDRRSAELAILITDSALKQVDGSRADLGSVQNQLESTIRNISVTQVNVTAAESQIRDVDFAQESANFAKLNILAQSGSYAMSQANAVQQNVMRLLQ